MPHHLKLISASGDHTARLWDVSTSQLTLVREFNGHSRSVKVATFPNDNCNTFATGGRDGAIIIWDMRMDTESEVIQKVDNRIQNAHLGGGPTTPSSTRRRGNRSATPKIPANASNSSVTGLVFQNEYTLISCGPGDGVIKSWDLRRCYSTLKKEPIAKHNLPYAGSSTLKGFTNLVIDDNGTRLYASCMDNNIYCYNIGSYAKDPYMIYSGASIKSFYIKSCLSPDGQYLLSGSSDEKAYIWNVKNSIPLATLTGHTYEVTSVAWASHQNNLDGGNMALVTCSDDACHKIWRIGQDEMSQDDQMALRGQAELNESYYSSYNQKPQLKAPSKQFESTPRSLRRIIEQSETTPTTTMSITSESISASTSFIHLSSSRKRSFKEICDPSDVDACRSDTKRPNIETRGRRLFSPFEPSTSHFDNDVMPFDGPSRSLTTILEELDTPASKNFQNHSPSPVKRQLNIIRSPEPVRRLNASPMVDYRHFTAILNSPTTNLPNYVLDPQEAPHFSNLTSPLRKQKKENVDWLTKMRKQKLLSAMEKTTTTSHESTHFESTTVTVNTVDKLKSIENKTDAGDVKKVQKKRETTILKFFKTSTTTTAKISSENA
jgi:denticleless